MMQQIAVTGASGQLGSALCRRLGACAIALDRSNFSLDDLPLLRQQILRIRPAALINCAAYTAVDKAESEPAACQRTNAEAAGIIAEACDEIGAHFTQISTDYVFDGPVDRRVPFREEDAISPQSVYARSKAAGEVNAARCERHLVVRTCGLYGTTPRRSNFVETMLRIGGERGHVRVVGDQVCTPSFVEHVADGILYLVDRQEQGIVHLVNQGATTWFKFATEIFRLANLDVRCERITSEDYNAPAARPAFSVLDTTRYEALGGPVMPRWEDALVEYLNAREVC